MTTVVVVIHHHYRHCCRLRHHHHHLTDCGSRSERYESVHEHHHHLAVVVFVTAFVGGRLRRRGREGPGNGVGTEAEQTGELPPTRTQNPVHQSRNADGKPKPDVLLRVVCR